MADAFGKALLDHLSEGALTYMVRRDDKYVDKGSLEIYFTDYAEWQDFEKEILGYVQGRVLDIGAGAGRHTLYLQNQGFEVHAIDISSLAAEVMKQRGVKNVYLMDLKKLDFPENYFDSILMMFNNFGLSGTVERTKELLRDLCKLTSSKAKIIATVLNPYKTDNPAHLAYHEKNRKAGKPSGQVRLRIEYKSKIGDWFSLLMVSPEELRNIIIGTGWSILKIVEPKEGGHYGVVLKKE